VTQRIRRCTPGDAEAIAAIYDPIVANTIVSFEETPPGADRFPWLALESDGRFAGYVYASQHRARAGYRWSVDVSVYVAPEARRQGVARRLYRSLFEVLATQGYYGAFAGVTLPNDPSVRLHQRRLHDARNLPQRRIQIRQMARRDVARALS
jgi:phosphinothricin acetyltransferase